MLVPGLGIVGCQDSYYLCPSSGWRVGLESPTASPWIAFLDAAVSDARNAIAKGDFRLLAVMGYATEIPVSNGGLEVVERFNAAVKSNEVSVIGGTSDTPAGQQCAELNNRARRYAAIYNKEILSVPRPLK